MSNLFPSPDIVADGVTPLMAQYLSIKAAHPDSLLFYRMGDFYELFFEDAAIAARALDITLTKRGKHNGADIQMCGVPVHAADAYLARLIRAGHKVAVCEQTEDPAAAKKRGSKAVVRRDVIRLVTPGTLTEDGLLDARRANFLAALARSDGGLALAWVEISTGDLVAQTIEAAELGAALARLAPGELLLSSALMKDATIAAGIADFQTALTPLEPSRFDSQAGLRQLTDLFKVATLDGFGAFSRAELAALGGLVDYIHLTQKGKLPTLKAPSRIEPDSLMMIDAPTRRNLELTETLSGERRGSLLTTIDRTITGAGARLLGQRLAAPLARADAINARLDLVQGFVIDVTLRRKTAEILARTPDVERALSRLSLGRGGPRDLAAVRDALAETRSLRDVIEGADLTPPPGILRLADLLGHHGDLVAHLREALAAELPPLVRDGNFIAQGFRPDLDETRLLRDESRRHIAGLQQKYADATGVPGLKIRHNNLLGYFIEITPRHTERMGTDYIHRQTMANAVRYSTVELGELESKISQAADRTLALELGIFDELVGQVLAHAPAILVAASALAEIDVASALATLAVEQNYCRPTMDDGLAFDIKAGRHPVVEAALRNARGPAFVPNDCALSEQERLWLVTGPNMAGKSTFLRQQALIAIMAQIGAYVPADAAHIGTVDRLFSRVGAADDLARGRSTFMVEMVETAAILNQAGPRSLVILDEIGRGTATFDGLSIAWAAVEYLHEINCSRALFATHYHELTVLTERLPHLANRTMRVKEWQGDVVFLHEVAAGAADRSYGIQVAKLAGLPAAVIARAATVLAGLEQKGQTGGAAKLATDLPLFRTAVPDVQASPRKSAVEEALKAALLDELTPRQALELLYQLKGLIGPS